MKKTLLASLFTGIAILLTVYGCRKTSLTRLSASAVFYLETDCGGGDVSVTVNGTTKVLKHILATGQVPTCGDTNTVTFNLTAGMISYTVSDDNGTWTDSVKLTASTCNKISLKCQAGTTSAVLIDPADANALQAALVIPGAILRSGAMPVQTTGVTTPSLFDFQETISSNPGTWLYMPFNFTAPDEYLRCYLQVKGATNGFYEISGIIPNVGSTTKGGTILLPVTLPQNVKYGNFCLNYIICDKNRVFSNVLQSCVTIAPPVTCSNASAEGSEGLTFTTVHMNNGRQGNVVINYDTYTVPDRIDVYQGTTWLTGMGSDPHTLVPPQCDCDFLLPGFRGEASQLRFNYDSTKGKNITVVVSGCLNGGTLWEWQLICP
jgi:hypothetical protein